MSRTKNVRRKPSASLKIVDRWKKQCKDRDSLRPSTASAPPPPASEAPHSTQTIDKCMGKVIAPGRQINFKFLHQERFQIGELMKGMTWRFLCSLDVVCYLSLIKEFYNT